MTAVTPNTQSSSQSFPDSLPWTFVARVEPWAFLVAILGILFAPPKGVFWFLLIAVALLRTLRLWREKWQAYRPDTAAQFLHALITVPILILLYFGLARVWPSIVYQHPQQMQVERFTLAPQFQMVSEGSHAFLAELRVTRDPKVARSFRITGSRLDPSGMVLGQFSGYLRERGMSASKRQNWHSMVKLDELRGSFLPEMLGRSMDQRYRAQLGFNEKGQLLQLQILREGRTIYSARLNPVH